MGEQHSVPTGDGSPLQWNIQPTSPTTHYTKVDEVWTSPSITDYIHETIDYQTDIFIYPADGPAAMAIVHTVHIDFYINTTNVSQLPGITIVLYKGSTYITSGSWQINTGGVWQRKRFTFTGLNLTKAEYNTLNHAILCMPGDPGWPTPTESPNI